MRSQSRLGAVILIVIGVIFLLINLGFAPVAELRTLFAKWWPLILIALGAWMLVRPRGGGS